MRTRIAALLIAVLTATVPIAWADSADAARKAPDRMNLQAMARYYHCDILATPGRDWFRGPPAKGDGLLIGNQWKGYYHLFWQQVGWEPPKTIVAVCQF